MIRTFRLCALCAVLASSACSGRDTAPSQQPNAPSAKGAKADANETPTPAAPASWQTFHGPPTLEGAVDVELPESLAPVWKYDAGAPITNTPVVGNDRVCVADRKGGIHATDLKGKKIWSKSFSTPGQPSVDFEAPIALFDSTLVACTSAGRIYALDPANGDLRWSRDTGLPILGSPTLASVRQGDATYKRLFVIDQSDGVLQSFDLDTGEPVWSSTGVGRCDGSPAANGSVAAFGSCASAVHVFSAVTGQMIHEISLDEESQVAGGVVLVGDEVFSASRSGKFIRANTQTGRTIWANSDCTGEAFSTPAVGGDWVIFTANDGVVYALDRQSGALKWKQNLAGTPSSPVITHDKVIVTSGGALHLLRLTDGAKLWSYAISDEVTSPALAGTLVLVGSDDGTLTAFAPKES